MNSDPFYDKNLNRSSDQNPLSLNSFEGRRTPKIEINSRLLLIFVNLVLIALTRLFPSLVNKFNQTEYISNAKKTLDEAQLRILKIQVLNPGEYCYGELLHDESQTYISSKELVLIMLMNPNYQELSGYFEEAGRILAENSDQLPNTMRHPTQDGFYPKGSCYFIPKKKLSEVVRTLKQLEMEKKFLTKTSDQS